MHVSSQSQHGSSISFVVCFNFPTKIVRFSHRSLTQAIGTLLQRRDPWSHGMAHRPNQDIQRC